MKLTISLAQMDIVFGDPQANLAVVNDLAAEAARRGSDVLVLPELWSTAYDLENAPKHATATDAGIFAAVADLAAEHQLHIAGSCLSVLGEGAYGNTLTWHDNTGALKADYSKLHLFRLMQEEQYLTGGERAQVVDVAGDGAESCKTGLAICYDLRFPELFRQYALAGANIVLLPAEWPHPRLMHWRTLLRARAIENQMYVVACNRVGSAGDTVFFGHSCIIDPWGEIVIEAGETETLLTATIDTAQVPTVRAKIPIFKDRRPEVYDQDIS